MSDTKNVKLGICSVNYAGTDLGYTKGGVEVTVTTDTYKVQIDQFGTTEIAETVRGRQVKVKVPMAETTLNNLVAIMPGATLTSSGGVVASGSINFAANPANGDTVTVNGVVFTFKTAPSVATDIGIGVSAAATQANALTVLEASTNTLVNVATFATSGTKINVTYATEGSDGNDYTLAVTGTAVTVIAMSGGVDPIQRVDVTTALGINLLDTAQPLILHPTANAVTDLSEDFTIPLAGTAGAITFAYKVDQERIYNVEFSGYPDPATSRLFAVGNPNA